MGRRRGEHLGMLFYTRGPCTSLYLSPNSKARTTSQRQLRVVTGHPAPLKNPHRCYHRLVINVGVLGYTEASGRM